MRCKSCNYALWRLKARTCPECGAPFKPSEHLFEPNSVRFRCPHCTQEYYGTDPNGLLTPREFDCVRCNAHIHMDEMVLEPAAGLSDEISQRSNPWLDPRKMGRFSRWMKTVGMSLTRPTELMRGTPRGRSGAAIWFALRSNLTYSLVGTSSIALMGLVLGLGMGAAAGGRAGGGAGVSMIVGLVVGVAGGLLATAIALVVLLGLWTMATHAILRLTGPVAGNLSDTGECLCYASGANVLAAIPCLGFYASAVSWIWPAISGALMLCERQKVSGLRAGFAAVLPPMAFASAAVGLFIWFVVWSMGNAANMRLGLSPLATATSINMARARAASDGMDASMHAAYLVTDNNLMAFDLVPHSGENLLERPVVDQYTLNDLELDTALPYKEDQARRTAVANAFRQAVPDSAPAYRLGDVVFIKDTGDKLSAGLRWSAVVVPEGGLTRIEHSIVVVDQFGGTKSYPLPTFQRQLGLENAARVAAGLAPIPDPATIPHDQRNWTPPPPVIDNSAIHDASPDPAEDPGH